jgi:iron complex outermembrane receptor protein
VDFFYQSVRPSLALFAVFLTNAPGVYSQSMLDEVVVSASRSEQKAFDAHGSIDVVNRQTIERSGPQINLSEALGMTPGIFVANRNNLAQDLQVSIRGYGSRAPFGVRGVRLMVDGLPQSLPDGQGQTSQFAATSASRIEVLKGPVASLYGNASGGVLQAFTREPSEDPELLLSGFTGSDNLYRSSFQYSDTRGDYGFVVDYGLLAYEGFREYSEAKRSHLNSKLVLKGEDRKTNFIFNVLDQTKGEDPGSRTLTEFRTAPYRANAFGKAQGVGKTYRQSIVGAVHEQRTTQAGTWQARAYVATRDLDSPIPNNKILIDRVQWGLGLQNQRDTRLAGTAARLSLGLEFDHVRDDRQTGKPPIAEPNHRDNVSTAYGLWGQMELFPSESLSLSAGLRLSSVYLKATNNELVSGDTSGGSRRYFGNAVYLGMTRHLGEATNLYATVGSSFETPTLNETLYVFVPGQAQGDAAFNTSIDAAKSIQWEAGLKHRTAAQGYAQLALFGAQTKDDIVPQLLSTSNSVWQNADTRRLGLELSARQTLGRGLQAGLSAQWIKAEYDQALSVSRSSNLIAVASGNRIPGIPRDRVQAELTWSTKAGKLSAGQPSRYATLEFVSLGVMDVNSDNSQATDRANVWNLRLGSRYPALGGEVLVQVAIENLADKLYAGSVIVDQAFERYYEPGAPRQYLLGLQYKRMM